VGETPWRFKSSRPHQYNNWAGQGRGSDDPSEGGLVPDAAVVHVGGGGIESLNYVEGCSCSILFAASQSGNRHCGDMAPGVGSGQEMLDGLYGLLILQQWCVALVGDRKGNKRWMAPAHLLDGFR
jgi:hypothetical protein